MADEFPTSFKDPQYASLDSATEQKLGLPSGLLAAVRTRGERSNNDQTSSAGATTPYQFIPATRRAILDKYGIDVKLSPQNASEGAGLLLKEGLDRNNGDVPLAVAEYTGGLDRKNWGPVTKSYVARVTGTPLDTAAVAPPAQAPGAPTQSTFDRLTASAPPPPAAIANIYAAYQSGQMPAADAKQFEQDVNDGHIMLPRGATLKNAAPSTPAGVLPNGVIEAYTDGRMGERDRRQLFADVQSGMVKLPSGLTLGAAPQEPQAEPDTETGGMPVPILGNVGNAETLGTLVSGAVATPLAGIAGLGAAAGNALGLTNADPADVVRNVAGALTYQPRTAQGQQTLGQANYPLEKLAQVADVAGGKVSDVTGSPALGAATNAALQVGGPMLLGKVGGGVVGAVDAVKRIPNMTPEAMAIPEIDPARAVIQNVTADPATAVPPPAVAPVVAAQAPAAAPVAEPVPVAAAPEVAPASVQDVAQVARKAAEGGRGATNATRDLVDLSAPDPKTVAAGQRLGIGNYLQSDHVTTNDGYRQVVGVLKSDPTSELALAEKQGLSKVAERASNLIDEIGGTTDLSTLDSGIKKRMQAAHDELSAREDGLYNKLRQEIPAATEAPATGTLDFIAQRAKDLGGVENLTPMEKQLVAKLSPKGGGDAAMLDSLGPAARKQAIEQGASGEQHPTYALVDDMRKQVGAAAKQAGPFSDADTGLAKKIYGLLSDDQGAVAEAAGAGKLNAAAKAATVVRKGMENDLASLFGKHLDGSIVGDVGQAMKSAAAGDTSKLVNLLRATPESMRGEVVASGLQTVFRNAATRGEINFTGFAKWYEGLLRNKQAHAAVMSNLPKAARKQLSDLYRVSKGISDSLGARIKTGLRSSVLEAMNAPDTLATKLYGLAGSVGKGLAVDVVGGHGAGMATALYSALSRNKTPAAKAIDTLLTSTEFVNLARNAGTPKQPAAIAAMSNSPPFRKFMRTIHQQNATSEWRQQWLARALVPATAANHRN